MIKNLRFFLPSLFVLASAFCYAQAPNISYATPQTYNVGVAISPLVPVNTGGAVSPSTQLLLHASLGNVTGVAFDAAGNVYAVDNSNSRIVMIPPHSDNNVTIGFGYNVPTGVAVDDAGNVYVTDFGNNAVKKVPADGGDIVTVGSGFSMPYGIAIDKLGNLFVSDRGSNTIKKITAGGVTTTYASGFNTPTGVAVDTAGNVYLTDRGNNAIKKIAPGGVITTLASGNGNPNGVAVDGAGNVYFADTNNSSIIEIPKAGGTPVSIGSGFHNPAGVAVTLTGDVYIADSSNGTVKKVKSGGYAINPALPTGLNFDAMAGIISGTPASAIDFKSFTVTAFNASGIGMAIINIKVDGSGPHITYPSPLTFTTGVAISPVSPTNSGTAVPNGGYAIGPSLPAGLGFNVNTGVISGTPIVNQSLKNYTVTATNPGGQTSQVVGITVNAPQKPIINYTNPLVFTVSMPVSPVAPVNTGGQIPVEGASVIASGAGTIRGMAVDSAGNMYIADASQQAVRKIPAGGGTPVVIASAFNDIQGIAADAAGNVFVADKGDNTIRKIPADGGAPVIFGGYTSPPCFVAVDKSGYIYISNASGDHISQTRPDGQQTLRIRTSGIIALSGLAAAPDGALYLTDSGDNTVKRINGDTYGYLFNAGQTYNTVTLATGFNGPTGLALDTARNIFVSDGASGLVKRIPAGGGSPVTIGSGFNHPLAIALDASGNNYVLSGTYLINIIKQGDYFITPSLPAGLSFNKATGVISGMPTKASAAANYTVTGYNTGGNGKAIINIKVNPYPLPQISYQGPQTYHVNDAIPPLMPTSSNVGPAGSIAVTVVASGINSPRNVTVDAAGNVYFSQFANNLVKKIPAAGGAPVVIGTGFNGPVGVAIDNLGNVYVADNGNNVVKKIPVGGGGITTVASGFNQPYGLAIDAGGNLFVTNLGNGLLQKIPAGGGAVTTVGPTFSHPTGVTLDGNGNIYISDNITNLIQKIPVGRNTAVTLASNVNDPYGVAVDGGGNVYYAELYSTSVKEIPASGGAVISIGSGLNYPQGITIDTKNNLYIPDFYNSAIKEFTPTGGFSIAPALPAGLSFNTGTGTISGVPVVPSPATDYTVTAYNIGGSTSTKVNIKIVSTNALLKTIVLAPQITLTTTTGPGYRNYKGAIPNNVSSIQVTANAQDTAAIIMVNGTTVKSGVKSQPIALKIGVNVINIVVTATDGVTTKNYIITATRAGSTVATLSNLVLSSGTLSPAFTPVTTGYTATVPFATPTISIMPTATDTAAMIKVNGTQTTSGTPVGVSLNVGPNTIITMVTATDGVSTQSDTVTVTRQPASNNALLNSIVLTPKITLKTTTGPGYRNYIGQIPNDVDSIRVTPTAQDPTALIRVNGVIIPSGQKSQSIGLFVGNNAIDIVVTAEDGTTTKTYIINANRAASPDATLSNLTLSTGMLSPTFASATTDYTATVPNATSSVKVTPTYTVFESLAAVNGIPVPSGHASADIPLNVGPNTITVYVRAQDAVHTMVYTLTVTRAAANLSTNALLNTLVLSPKTTVTLTTGPGYRNYTAAEPNSVSSVQVTANASEASATITVNGMAVAQGVKSQVIPLSVGSNVITTVVTAQDGATTKSYIITLTRAAASLASQYVEVAPQNTARAGDINVHQNLSPNGDGNSDVLVIDGIAAHPDNKLQIMSRSGVLVYEAKGYDNATKVFDGHSSTNGKLQRAGTYFYSLEYKDGDAVKHKTGFIVLKY